MVTKWVTTWSPICDHMVTLFLKMLENVAQFGYWEQHLGDHMVKDLGDHMVKK